MRTRYVQDKHGNLVPVEEARAWVHEVMPDIEPYQSMIDGTIIKSRAQHRSHLRAHGCVEVGNEVGRTPTERKPVPDFNPEGRRELLQAQVNQLSHSDYVKMRGRFFDELKWNSRKD